MYGGIQKDGHGTAVSPFTPAVASQHPDMKVRGNGLAG
jgi:hypothetical protein